MYWVRDVMRTFLFIRPTRYTHSNMEFIVRFLSQDSRMDRGIGEMWWKVADGLITYGESVKAEVSAENARLQADIDEANAQAQTIRNSAIVFTDVPSAVLDELRKLGIEGSERRNYIDGCDCDDCNEARDYETEFMSEFRQRMLSDLRRIGRQFN